MTNKFNFMSKELYFLIIILIYSFKLVICIEEQTGNEETYNKSLGALCTSNLECNSICCSSNRCSSTHYCGKMPKYVILVNGLICLLFIIGFTIYLILQLRKIEKEFEEKIMNENKYK